MKLLVTFVQSANPWLWDTPPRKIDDTQILPAYNAVTMIIVDCSKNPYHKRIDLLPLGMNMFDDPPLHEITARGIQTCELLRGRPHPNVCVYRGVTVDNELVSSLVFDRYDMTLGEMVRQRLAFDVDKCLQDIANGITHMHSLGLVHCDIKPENIFVDMHNQRFVVGDFDSAHRERDMLDKKGGTKGWVPLDEDTSNLARKDIDYYSYTMLVVWLGRKGGGEEGWRASATGILARARSHVGGAVRIPTTLGRPADGEEMDMSC
jgi:serine/threonine protein kinase